MTRILLPRPSALAALGTLLFVPSLAHAQECATDADCPATFVCEVTGGSACAGVACPPNEPCPPPPPCEPIEYRECVPGPCESDADCADGMLCRTETWESCTATDVACAPDGTCPPPAPTECTTETHSQCVYRHEMPCTVDADCGPAFQCIELESCWCDGGGSDPVDPGFAPPPDPAPAPAPTCGCSPSGDFVCTPREIPCSNDTNCPESWTCESAGGGGTCSGGTDVPGGEPIEPVCTTEPEVLMCQPPSSGYYYGVDIAAGAPTGETGAGGATNGTTGPGTDGEPAPPDPAAGGQNGATPDGTGEPAGDIETHGTSSSGDSGGCSVSAAPKTGSGWGALALLAGLAVGRRRRRAH